MSARLVFTLACHHRRAPSSRGVEQTVSSTFEAKFAASRWLWVLLIASGACATLGCSSRPNVPDMAQGTSSRPDGGTFFEDPEPCSDGEIRGCNTSFPQQGTVQSCYDGTQTCIRSKWSRCEAVHRGLLSTNWNMGRKGASLSQPFACEDNPCDPTCQTYNEKPVAPIVASVNSNVGWWTGAESSLSPDILPLVSRKPCQTAADCQQNQHCVNVATDSSCSHDKCAIGGSYDAMCADTCVSSVCAEHPQCCRQTAMPRCRTELGEISDGHGHCFYLQAPPLDWPSARVACAGRGAQWDLVCIDTQDDEDFLIAHQSTDSAWTQMRRFSRNVTGSRFYCPATPAVAPLADGLVVGAYPWWPGEPNNSGGGENCVSLLPNGFWNDFSCWATLPSWCKGPPTPFDDWNQTCVDAVALECGVTCAAAGTDSIGQCQAWGPGESNALASSFDLGIDIPCNGQVPVCNHGTRSAPAGAIIHVLPTHQIATRDPSVANEIMRCTTAAPIEPGACVMATGCASYLSVNDATLWVEAPAGSLEWRVDDNWAYNIRGTGCVIPHCASGKGCVSQQVVSQDYEGNCAGAEAFPQWSYLQWHALTPADSSIEFLLSGAESQGDLDTATPVSLATISRASGNEDCLMTGPAPVCPADLYGALQPSGAAHSKFIRITAVLKPSSDGSFSPELNDWRINYACPDSI